MNQIEAVVETAIYVDDLEAAEAFYRELLGLEVIGREPGRHVFFRVGDGVLLAFDPEATLKGDTLPPHGPRGPGHFALGVRAEGLDDWRQKLEGHGVAVEK
jgi:catechol 2,3-dioxygenase-like lactoylglutathione lyase family enzyme